VSLVRQFAAVGQNATAAFEEETITNERTGKSFLAKVQPITDLALLEAIGQDSREVVTIHTRDQAAANDLNEGDVLSTLNNSFKSIRTMANPASLHVAFICIRGLPGKDDWA
jgi:hypothetical protein